MDSSAKLVEEGRALLRLKKYTPALEKFSKALVANPVHPLARWGVGVCQIKQGKVEEGKKELLKGFAEHAKEIQYCYSLYVVARKENNKTDAHKWADTFIKVDPVNPKGYSLKAWLLLESSGDKQLKQWKTVGLTSETAQKALFHFKKNTVIELAKKSLKLGPLESDSWETMAFVYWKILNDKKNALSHINQAIRLDPSSFEHHHNAGLMYQFYGDSRRALDEFRFAIRLDPSAQISVSALEQAMIATHPLFAWAYKYGLLFKKYKWGGFISLYVLVEFVTRFTKAGYIPVAFGGGLALIYVIISVYLLFGTRLYLFAFKKGWIQ